MLHIISEQFSNDPEELMQVCFNLRAKYIDSLSQEDLQLSMLAGKLSLYGNLIYHRLDAGVMSLKEYAENSARYGSSFTNALKKAKGLATLSTLSKMKFLDLTEKINDFNSEWGKILTIDINRNYSYDDFLNEDNLLFFNDEDVDDLKWSQEPLEINEGALDHFRDILREILEKYKTPDLQSPSKSETAVWTSDSTSWECHPENRTVHRNIVRKRLYEGSQKPFGELTNKFLMRRSIVPVAPGNFRDSWEPDFDTLFTIKSISYVMRQVVQPIPYSAMYDANIAYRRKKKLLEKESLFLMLDYKKSAITIPREILTIMGEELSSVYDNIEFKYIQYYKDLTLYVDNKIYPTVRGVGLGNMNELYTLMQCVFGHFSKKAFDTGSIFFNDDAAYQLHASAYRRQAVLIMSFIRATGCILNLSKCLISESTIFCEEYRVRTGFDYRKIQLLVLPMLNALYCPNTAIAKRYMYSIDRGLVGTGMKYLSYRMLNLLTQVYSHEFGKMDQLLPYQLGGWIDFSETNFSCLVEYCIDPWQYLTTPNELGSIPEIRRWIAYNLSEFSSESILSSKARIAYRGNHIINSQKDLEIFKYKDSLSDYLYGYCGLQSVEDYENSIDSVVNNRGLHNAKPKIKFGLAQKYMINRKRIYRDYKRFSKEKLILYSKDAIGLNRILRYIKSMDDSPSLLSFPRCFLKESYAVSKGKNNHKIVVYKTSEERTGKTLPDSRKSIAATIDSIRDKRWYYRSDPFIFHDFWRRKKSGYLISEKSIPNILRSNYTLPVDFRVFCPNATLFIREFAVRTGRLPLSWSENSNLISEFKMYLFKDTFEIILPPDLIGEWREVKNLFKKDLYQLRNILSSMNLRGRNEFKAFLITAKALYEREFQQHSPPDLYTVDEDILQILENFEEENLYSHIISDVYTAEDLLDDEGIYDLADSSFSDEDSEYSLEDFEVFDGDDSEAEDSDPGFNEIRRMARQGDPSTIQANL